MKKFLILFASVSALALAGCGEAKKAEAPAEPAKTEAPAADAAKAKQAAVANKAWFFPINPGAEEASWQQLHDEGVDRFLGGRFDEAYQKQLLAEFDRRLPETPSW